jgi:predicted O-methyltransferase YrrM
MVCTAVDSVCRIRGATSAAELAHLYKLACQVTTGCIVEIGAFQGRSTAALALGSKSGGGAAVFSIEPHETFTGVLGGCFGPRDRVAFFRNMLDFDVVEQVRLISVSSEVVTSGWTTPVALLWIDGDHRYDAVRRDVDCWLRHLTADAVVVFDDAETDGPKRVIAEQLARGWVLVTRVGKTATLAPVPSAMHL